MYNILVFDRGGKHVSDNNTEKQRKSVCGNVRFMKSVYFSHRQYR